MAAAGQSVVAGSGRGRPAPGGRDRGCVSEAGISPQEATAAAGPTTGWRRSCRRWGGAGAVYRVAPRTSQWSVRTRHQKNAARIAMNAVNATHSHIIAVGALASAGSASRTTRTIGT